MLIYVRKSIRKGLKIKTDFDQDVVEVIMNKNCFCLQDDKHILLTYASPFNSSYTKSRPINVLEKMETKEADYQNTLIMGDLNGRTKMGDDFVRDSLDKYSPINISTYVKDNVLKRNNMDHHAIDQQGRIILDLCKSSGLKVLNGRISGDSQGHFTHYPLNKPNESPSTIDYALCGTSMMREVFSFSVLPFTELSDHCCISVTIKVNREYIVNHESEPNVKINPIKVTFIFDKKRYLRKTLRQV